MKKYFCDVCGEQIKGSYTRPEEKEREIMQQMTFTPDVCERCLQVGEYIIPHDILLRHWRTMVEKEEEK